MHLAYLDHMRHADLDAESASGRRHGNRRIVRETTHWNFREVGVQLGALEAPLLFWKQ